MSDKPVSDKEARKTFDPTSIMELDGVAAVNLTEPTKDDLPRIYRAYLDEIKKTERLAQENDRLRFLLDGGARNLIEAQNNDLREQLAAMTQERDNAIISKNASERGFKEVEKELQISKRLHKTAVDVLDRIGRGDDYRDATKFEMAWEREKKDLEYVRGLLEEKTDMFNSTLADVNKLIEVLNELIECEASHTFKWTSEHNNAWGKAIKVLEEMK